MKRLRDYIRRLVANAGACQTWGSAGLATVLYLLCSVAQASSNEASHGAHDTVVNWWGYSQTKPPIGWFIVDFVIFIYLLQKFASPPIKTMLIARYERVKLAIEENTKAHAKAAAHREEYRDKLANVQEEIRSLVEGARTDGAKQRDHIVTAAKSHAKRLKRDVSHSMEQEIAGARARLRQETAITVMTQAHQLLSTVMSDADRDKLLNQSLVQLEKGSLSSNTPRNAPRSPRTPARAAP